MSPRTVNVVIGFTSPDVYPEPMVSQYNISTYGYKSPDDPHYFAPPRLKSNVTFEKSIGTVFWGTRSGVDFGNIDIAIEDGGIDSIAGEEVRWVEWAKENLNPQVTISVELGDGTLLHLATADTTDIFFPDSETIRVKLQAKHSRALQEYINDYFDTSYDVDVQGLPVPIYLGSGAIGGGGYDPSTFDPSTHVPAVLVDTANLRYVAAQSDLVDGSPSAYFVLDAGTVLREGESPGFTLWENGFELTSNPEDPITFVWVADQGGGVEDPYETGALLQGPFRICRWAVGQAGIDLDEFFPGETSFPDLIPSGFDLDEEQVPLLYYGSEVTAEKILDDCVLNLCGYWYVDELGFFDFGFFDAPEGITPSFAYTDVEMIGDIASTADRAPGLSALMEFSYSPGAFDIGNMAGSVSNVRRRRLSQEWRQVVTTEAIPEVYTRARGNEPMKFYNGGQNRPGVLDELNRRWSGYYSGVRRFYDWSIPLRGNEVLPELGNVGTIRSERAELLAYGDLPLVLTRIKYDLGRGLIHLRGWGGETASPPLSEAVIALVQSGEDMQAYQWDFAALEWSAAGSGFADGDQTGAAAGGFATGRVAYTDTDRDEIRTYAFDGSDWYQDESALSITISGSGTITALTDTRVAEWNPTDEDLRAFDWDGTDWATSGTPLAFGGVNGNSGITALSSTDVAFVNGSNDWLRTYRLDSGTWAQEGNSLTVDLTGSPSLTTLTATRIAVIDGTDGGESELYVYDWDGTDWAETYDQNMEEILSGSTHIITALSDDTIAVASPSDDALRTLKLVDGTWEQQGSSFDLGTVATSAKMTRVYLPYAGPPPPFSPDEIPDLVSWLDAAETSTMIEAGGSPINGDDEDPFEKWNDTLASSPVPAYYKRVTVSVTNGFEFLDSVNGYPAVSPLFAGDVSAYDSGGLEISAVSQGAQTIFAVASVNSGETNDINMLVSTADATNTGGLIIFFDTRTQRRASLAISSSNNQVYGDLDARDQTTGVRVLAGRMTGTSGELDTWRDGTLTADSPETLSGGAYWTAGSVTFICSAPGIAGQADLVFLHEILIYDRALTDEEVGEVNDYLNDKYGL